MRILRLPARQPHSVGDSIGGIIFDLDNTLYTHPAYAQFQEDVLFNRLGQALSCGRDEAIARIAARRAERAAAGLPATSLGNLFLDFGIDIATSVSWREEDIEPRDWLRPDPRLVEALQELAAHFSLALVSNNPRLIGEKSLEALGVRRSFSVVVGLDSTLRSKPEPAAFILAAKLLEQPAARCLSVGDRPDIDIAPALALGMSGIVVDGVEDVYRLPEVLLGAGEERAGQRP